MEIACNVRDIWQTHTKTTTEMSIRRRLNLHYFANPLPTDPIAHLPWQDDWMSHVLKITLNLTVVAKYISKWKVTKEFPQKASLLFRKGCERFTSNLPPPPPSPRMLSCRVQGELYVDSGSFWRVDNGSCTVWDCVIVVKHVISQNFVFLGFENHLPSSLRHGS